MASRLLCWKCGGSLARLPGRMTRLSLCPDCRADLHVCRMCRFHDPGVRSECTHERADRVIDKELANFRTHFRPRPNAHRLCAAFRQRGRRERV